MIVAAAIVVALICIAASARRLWIVAAPTALEPDDVIDAVKRGASIAALRSATEGAAGADWERDLFDALAAETPEARAALVNEQLTELDLRLKEWERVPRVCASVSTSLGILLGTLVLRRGLADAPDLTGELGELFVRSIIGDAVTVVAFGIAGTAFCIAAASQAKRLARARLEGADRMIEKLETL